MRARVVAALYASMTRLLCAALVLTGLLAAPASAAARAAQAAASPQTPASAQQPPASTPQTAPVEAPRAVPAPEQHQPEAPGAPAAPEHAAAASDHAAEVAAADHGAQAEHGAEAGHHESIWSVIAPIVNFIVLIGGLVYFLRAPLGNYLNSRSQQIRTDLVTAKDTTAAATAQLAEIARKLEALPAEIEELKKRGAQEIVAEEARIKQGAEAERHRLLEQTRREIDLRLRLAKRELTEHAATLAVDLASDRIRQTATPDDQQRLIDRYATQVRSAHE